MLIGNNLWANVTVSCGALGVQSARWRVGL
jgi:hypothetical protein